MPEVQLTGVAPVPIASYLKGLAVLRLVSEQVDPEARGWWDQETFWLDSKLDRDGLLRFFACAYRPTPIVAPWNAGSGFYAHKTSAFNAVSALSEATAERFSPYRTVIRETQRLLSRLGISEPPKDERKTALITAFRNELPDVAVEWLDAVVVLTTEGQSYPPILGTGGNDGNMEFTVNFILRLQSLFDLGTGKPASSGTELLAAALFSDITQRLTSDSIGQFYPGAAGGPNSTTGVRGDAKVNPWDYILMLEGSLAFAAHATRRLGSHGRSVLSYPFTVEAASVGHGSVSDDEAQTSRAEMWLPLWRRPARYAEVTAVFREGRAQVGLRAARNGLDFARACAKLGVDRGIESYQRYSFSMRNGRSYLAVPLGRMHVRRRVEADLVDDLSRGGWLDQLARAARSAGQALESAHRRIAEAVWQLTQHGGAVRVQMLIRELGKLERLLADRADVRESLPPLALRSSGWLTHAWDGSSEFAVAVGLASLDAPDMPALRSYVSPVRPHQPDAWSETEHPHQVWRQADLLRNLTAFALRRALDAERAEREVDKPFGGQVAVPFHHVLRFLYGQTDDDRVQELLLGLLALTSSREVFRSWRSPEPAGTVSEWLPWSYAVLKLLFVPNAVLGKLPQAGPDIRVPLPQNVLRALASGDARQCKVAVQMAERRLFASGLAPVFRGMDPAGLDSRRLLAACLVPISASQVRILARRVLEPPEQERAEETPTTAITP